MAYLGLVPEKRNSNWADNAKAGRAMH